VNWKEPRFRCEMLWSEAGRTALELRSNGATMKQSLLADRGRDQLMGVREQPDRKSVQECLSRVDGMPLRTALVTLHDEESLKLRAHRLFHLKGKTVGIRLTVGRESSYSLTRFCARFR
jgi:hypothetical protein